jgi:murein DD-endopeptidase MepM/ murein hydrolase activator NlpD
LITKQKTTIMKKSILVAICFIAFGAVGKGQQSGGGSTTPPRMIENCIPPAERFVVEQQLKANVERLTSQGILVENRNSSMVTLFRWPLEAAPGFTHYGFYGISNYVDQNPAYPNQLLDWNCGNRTYDLSDGYNHQGIDIYTDPFPWYMMDNDEVHVVAAAAGIILNKNDGAFDRNCSFNNSAANYVILQHADGSRSWYWHLKNGSVTTKGIGASVSEGEYLGVVGSSGFSTGPHLHFEVQDPSGNLIDPYDGDCNNLNASSWWQNQKPYYESRINRLMTTFTQIGYSPDCGVTETLNISNLFNPGDLVFYHAFYQDQLFGQVSDYSILRPDGSIFQSWVHSSNADHYPSSGWYWSWYLPANAPGGTWRFEVVFEGETYVHEFEVIGNCAPPNINPINNATACGSYTLPPISGTNLTGSQAYYTGPNATGAQLLPGQAVTASGTYYAYDGTPGCSDQEAFSIAIASAPNITPINNATACGSYTLPPISGTNLTGSQAYYTGPNATGAQLLPGQAVTASGTYYAYDGAPGCADQEAFSIAIASAPNITPINNATACGSYTLPPISGTNLTGSQAYYTGPNATGAQLLPGQAVTASGTYYAYDGAPGCADQEAFSIAIASAPNIAPINNATACGSYTLPPISGTNLTGSQAYYTGPNATGAQLLPGQAVTASGTYYAYDGAPGCADQEAFSIAIASAPNITPINNATACGSYTLPPISGTNLTGSQAYYTGPNATGAQLLPGQAVTASGTYYAYDGAPGCSDQEAFSIAIASAPNITPINNATACGSYTLPPISGTNLTGSQAYYTGPNATGAQLLPGQAVTASGTYYAYDGAPGCSDQEVFSIAIASAPNIAPINNATACGSYTLPPISGTNLTGSQAYYTGPNATGAQLLPGQAVTASGTYYAYDGTPGCADQEAFSIAIASAPNIAPINNATACGSYTLPPISGTNLTGSQAYYTGPNATGAQLLPGQAVTASGTYYAYDGTPGCADQESFTITIASAPNIAPINNATACGSYTLPPISGTNLTGSQAYYTGPNATGAQLLPGQAVTASGTYYAYDGTPGCADQEAFSIAIASAPNIAPINHITSCNSYILPPIQGVNLSGAQAYYTGPGGTGTQYPAGAVIAATTTLYAFDSNAGCTDELNFTVSIAVSPILELIADVAVCAAYILPPIQGINLTGAQAYYTGPSGTGLSYSPGQTITSNALLYAYDGASGCDSEMLFIVEIEPAAVPVFTLPEEACSSDDPILLPFVSVNGIWGSWNLGSVLDLDLYSGTTVTSTFTPNANYCATTTEVRIAVTPEPVIASIISGPPSDCNLANGSLTIDAFVVGGEAEYSIDGGQSWQPGNIFTSLAAGSYLVAVRSIGADYCITESIAQIAAAPDTSPPILSGCPGRLDTLLAAGQDLLLLSWPLPFANDNCDPAPSLLSNGYPGASSWFGPGQYELIYTAVDATGNESAPCRFEINVIRGSGPVFYVDGNEYSFSGDTLLATIKGIGLDSIAEFRFALRSDATILGVVGSTAMVPGELEWDILNPNQAAVYWLGINGMSRSWADSSLVFSIMLQLPDSQACAELWFDAGAAPSPMVRFLDGISTQPDTYGALICRRVGLRIAGQIHSTMDLAMSAVEVNISGAGSTLTDSTGHYAIDALLAGLTYQVRPYSNANPTNGVNIVDLIRIQDHLLRRALLSEAHQYIAADVDGSSKITIADLVAIARLVMAAETDFPNGVPSWRFAPRNYPLTQPANPDSVPPYIEWISTNALSGDLIDVDFLGIKTGDVDDTHNWMSAPVSLRFEDQYLEVGQRLLARFSFDGEQNRIRAYQLALQLEKRLLTLDTAAFASMNNDHWRYFDWQNGTLKLIELEGDGGFVLPLEARQAGWLSQGLSLTGSNRMPSLAYLQTGELGMCVLEKHHAKTSLRTLRILSSQPNPFTHSTELLLNSDMPQLATLEVVSAEGQLVHRETRSLSQGLNAWPLHSASWGRKGLFFARIRTPQGLLSHTLICE